MDPSDFIIGIYEFLEANKICFLYGALVLDDTDGYIFNYLSSHEVYDKPRPSGIGATHMIFIRNSKFKERQARKRSTSSDDGSTEYVLDKSLNRRQYELPLVPPMNYICSKRCRQNPKKTDCEMEESNKGALLFYPFAVQNDKGDRRRYIYLKLEGYLHDKPAHMSSAFKRYVMRLEKKDTYKKRREDDVPLDHHLDDNLRISSSIKDSRIADIVTEKLTFYDTYVRVGNEVYVPDVALPFSFV